MDDLTPKALVQAIVEKNDRLIGRYSAELEAGERVSVLREKRDLLKHWISDGKSKEKNVKLLADVEGEIKKLEDSGLLKPQSYYKDLKNRIGERRESKTHWEGKAKEVG